MSMRSATRLARSSLRSSASSFAQRAPVVARRAASSGGGHKASGSDLPWILGSAAVFLPLGGYVATQKGAGHGADHSHDNPAENQMANHKQVDQHGRTGIEAQYEEKDPSDKNAEAAKGNKGGAENAENAPGVNPEKQAEEQAEAIESPKEATAVEEHGGEVNKAAAEKAGGNAEKNDEGKSGDVEEKKEEKTDDKSEGDAPSEEDIKASLHQAESAAVPRAAMAEESK